MINRQTPLFAFVLLSIETLMLFFSMVDVAGAKVRHGDKEQAEKAPPVGRRDLTVLSGGQESKGCVDAAGVGVEPRVRCGIISGVVFLEKAGHGPVKGVEVIVSNVDRRLARKTNDDGAFVFRLKPGEYRLFLKWGKSAVVERVSVVDGQTVELIFTLNRDGSIERIKEEIENTVETARKASTPKEASHLLEGVVMDLKESTPIEGAGVFVQGMREESKTDKDGAFRIKLPRGSYNITVIHPRYGTIKITGYEIPPQKSKRKESGHKPVLRIEMSPIDVHLDDVTVSAPRIVGGTAVLLLERQKTNMVKDIIGAEEMAKGGAGDAAGALRRVTGITVMGGKYVYVRGLGERYSLTLLNGSALPSPEPERRVVPLDMFPTLILDSVEIQKNYSPDMPGEFGGGAVTLKTRPFPSQFVASLSLSIGLVGGTTFHKGLKSQGGRFDVLGIDGGYRALPKEVEKASKDSLLLESDMFSQRGYTAEELQRFGRLMPNKWNFHRSHVWPNIGFSATVGDGVKIFGKKAGYFAALTYGNDWNLENRELNFYVLGTGGSLERAHNYKLESLKNTITLAGILASGIDLNKNHKLRFTSLFNRITDNENRLYEGYNRDVGGKIRVGRLRWEERMLLLQQVRGAHFLDCGIKLKLDWRYAFSTAMRDEPDRREYRYDQRTYQNDSLWLLSDRPEGNQRLFSELLDMNHDFGVDTSMQIKRWSWLDLKIKTGAGFTHKKRTVDTRRYKFTHKGPLSGEAEILSGSPEEIFVPENIGSHGFQFEEITRQTDNYNASQLMWGSYVSAALDLSRGFSLTTGFRVEGSRQKVQTYELFNPDNEPVDSKLNTIDILPILGFAWKPNDKNVVRLFYGRTVSRPDFRELSPATFNDVTGGRQIFGNPELNRAVLENLDLRWEWYPERGENLSLALFYKHFRDPIESIVILSATHSITYENAHGANNVGVELSGRKRLGFIYPSLRDLYFAGNLAFIWSRVVLPEDAGIQTSTKRPLQGQSPFVANLQFGYDNVDTETTVSLLYNVFGKRIQQVGALGAPDVYERPFHTLDFVFRQIVGKGISLQLKAKNILDLPVKLMQGDKEVEVFHRGRTFTLGISKKW